MGVEKQGVRRGEKNIIFRRGGGINIGFGPKYRPLANYYIQLIRYGTGHGFLIDPWFSYLALIGCSQFSTEYIQVFIPACPLFVAPLAIILHGILIGPSHA
jgi:hypothetical protein